MKVLIDKKGDFGFVTTKEAFHGRILDRKHQEIATIEYDNSTQRAKLLITMGEDSISLCSLSKFLAGTAGDFLIDGKKYGRYNHTKPDSLEMSTCAGNLILQVAEDDTNRLYWSSLILMTVSPFSVATSPPLPFASFVYLTLMSFSSG